MSSRETTRSFAEKHPQLIPTNIPKDSCFFESHHPWLRRQNKVIYHQLKKVATKGSPLPPKHQKAAFQPKSQLLQKAPMPWRPHPRHQRHQQKRDSKRPTPAKAPPQPLTKAPAKASSSISAPSKAPQSIKKVANKTLLHHQKHLQQKEELKSLKTVGGPPQKDLLHHPKSRSHPLQNKVATHIKKP